MHVEVGLVESKEITPPFLSEMQNPFRQDTDMEDTVERY
jgi:hypothetical protein